MSARYYWEEAGGPGSESATLTGDEARHLIRVMRAKPGDEFLLFDGKGYEYRAEAAEIGRGSVRLRILETRAVCNDPEIELSAAVALCGAAYRFERNSPSVTSSRKDRPTKASISCGSTFTKNLSGSLT